MSTKEKDLEAIPRSGSAAAEPEDIIGEVKDVRNADAALDFLRHEGEVREMTLEDEKRLRRKIDWMIMPLMWSCYCLQYLDKTLINYANVMGLEKDANVTKGQFSNLALIFYVTYLALEFPHGYGMQRLPTAKYLGVMVFLWGVIVAVTSACKSYGALVATRVLLGCFESAVAPSLILITSMWYKHNEQPPRVGIWYLGTGTGTIIGSLISYGFQHYHARTFYSWQIMFLVVGLVTCMVGILVVLLLPDNPMKSRLSHEQKVWAIERLRGNQTGTRHPYRQDQVSQTQLTLFLHRCREQALQARPSPRVLPRPANLAPQPPHHLQQRPQRRGQQLSGHHHQGFRLRLKDHRALADPVRRRLHRRHSHCNLPRWSVQPARHSDRCPTHPRHSGRSAYGFLARRQQSGKAYR